MSLLSRFQIAREPDKSKAIERLVVGSTPDFDFFLLIVLAVLMATIGLLIDSASVVIGSMLIAPILYPVLSLALSVTLSDYALFYRSVVTLGKAAALGVGLALLTTVLSPGELTMTNELVGRVEPSLAYFMIAVISGLAVAYSLFQPELNEAFPGIAVSVALLPPLASAGVMLGMSDWSAAVGAFALFAVNVLGILFAALVSFSLMNLSVKKQVVTATMLKEQKRIAEEQEAIRELDEKNLKQPAPDHDGRAPDEGADDSRTNAHHAH
ncbi:DUF389 domain-containing protein [Patescibacteria group bacterium]|jgi:uncharacterized hydrophobic protein (TIGR00271 family)|nr:DUF389 domain-containing protein [Patescibacteria group bacterium]